MRGPKPPAIELNDPERQELQRIVKRPSSAQQLVMRARIVLLAGQGWNNAQIAREWGISIPSVHLWRMRWLGLAPLSLDDLSVSERLEDAPRAGRPPSLSAEQVCQIVALACEKPATSGRPISQWSGREMADEVVKRGIVDTISARHARRLLKRGTCNPGVSATG